MPNQPPQAEEENPEDALLEALDAFAELVEEDPSAALEMFHSLPAEVQEQAPFQFELAILLRETGELEAAATTLRALTRDYPEDSDSHHLLADVLEDLGESEEASSHFLTTLSLDRKEYEAEPESSHAEVATAIGQRLEATIAGLPEPFRQRLAHVPFFVDALPSPDQVRDGLDPRALGLFEGVPSSETAQGPSVPTRIVLFSWNLQGTFGETDEMLDQVEITVLHEIGHFFDLDEDDLLRLGLG